MTAKSGIKDLGIPMKLPIFVNRFVCEIDAYDTRYSDAERDSPGKDNQSRVEAKEIKPKKVCRVHTRAQPDAQRCNNRTAPAYN